MGMTGAAEVGFREGNSILPMKAAGGNAAFPW